MSGSQTPREATLDVPPTDPSPVDPTTHSAAGFTKADSVSTPAETLEQDVPLTLLEGTEQPRGEGSVTAGTGTHEVTRNVPTAEGARDHVVNLTGRSAAVNALRIPFEDKLDIGTAGDREVYRSPDVAALEAAAEALARHHEIQHAIALWAIALRLRQEVTR